MTKLLILIPLFFAACLPKAPVKKICTKEARAGLTVYVKDSGSGAFLSDSVNVLANDGNYSEVLQLFFGNPPSFSGAWERAGTYIVSVSKRGYKTATSLPITVGEDECHVISQTHTIEIIPN